MRFARFPLPRWQTPLPPGVDGSWGPDVELFAARELGIRLDLAQRRALNRALATIGGRLAHRIYLYSTGRQSGKTVTVRSLIGWALTAAAYPDSWREILGLAYDRKQARIPYSAVLEDLRPLARRLGPAPRGGLSLTRYLGIRSGMHGRPTRTYDVGSKEAAAAIRGMSIDLAPFDEIRVHRTFDTWAALLPTTAARPEPLVFGTSTAGDARSLVLRALFDRGIRILEAGEDPAGFGMTWYAAREDGRPPLLELVDAARAGDRRALELVQAAAREATPAVASGRITPATVRSELLSLTPPGFVSERLNLWVDELGDEWLPAGAWARQAAPRPDVGDWSGARIILGVEAAPTWRRASIVVAAALADGRAWAGVVGDLDASSRISPTIAPSELVDELGRLAGAWHPVGVAYSSAAAAAPHVAAWAEAHDVKAWPLTAGQLRSASELLRSELVGGRLTHADDPLLAAQVRASRPSGAIEAGGWYLSIRASLGEIDALRAIAWAAWAAISPEALEAEPQIF